MNLLLLMLHLALSGHEKQAIIRQTISPPTTATLQDIAAAAYKIKIEADIFGTGYVVTPLPGIGEP